MEEGAQLTSCIEMQLLLLIQIFGPISPLGPLSRVNFIQFFFLGLPWSQLELFFTIIYYFDFNFMG